LAENLTYSTTTPAQEAREEKHRETLAESISGIAEVFVAGLFIITFVIQHFEIPSRSMEKTLLVGDHVFVDRMTPTGKELWPLMPYREIHRRDIAVFPSPAQPGIYLVKRIVAVPGDHIRLRNGALYLNGVRQAEPYVIHDGSPPDTYRDNFPASPMLAIGQVTSDWASNLPKYVKDNELVVPPDHYFAMGDNRDLSYDSRYWGFVPRQSILGSPLFIVWSLNQTEEDFPMNPTMSERISSFFHTAIHFFGITRWGRVLRLVH